jgi:CheY-like chemotaxis protein
VAVDNNHRQSKLKRILAVDDSPIILSLIKNILSGHDYQVETAGDGQEALEKYVKFRPHLVTLDLAMPGMDGYQTLRSLKEIDRYANVIMITASEHSSALEECLGKGAVGYVAKPFKPNELISVIEQASRSTNYRDRNIVSMFLLVADKIQNNMSDMFPASADLSITLEDVKVRDNSLSSSQSEDTDAQDESMSSAHASNLEDQSISNPEITMPSDEHVSFLTEIDGQAIGLVISLIKKSDLDILFGRSGDDLEPHNSKSKEFFNIINTKVLSQLADATHLKLKTKPTVYMKPKENEPFWRTASNQWKQITKASFRVNYGILSIPIEIQLWYNGGHIFS